MHAVRYSKPPTPKKATHAKYCARRHLTSLQHDGTLQALLFHNILMRATASPHRRASQPETPFRLLHDIGVLRELELDKLLTGRGGDTGEITAEDLRRSQRIRFQLVQVSPTRLRGTEIRVRCRSCRRRTRGGSHTRLVCEVDELGLRLLGQHHLIAEHWAKRDGKPREQ